MIDLYTYPTSNGRRASIMLEECGLAYKTHKIDLAKGEQKAPEFLEVNPAGQIPAIVDADGPGGKPLALAQSAAIVVYLAEKTGKLLPAEPSRRAAVLESFAMVMSDGTGSNTAFVAASRNIADQAPAAVEFFEKRLLGFMQNCDKRLAGREYLAGDISIADIALYPMVAQHKALIDKAGGLANLNRWAAKMAARPGVERGMKVPA
ncbi:MAG: glutathione S-transferase family protein [Pseudomonadota bacterium]